MYQRGQALREAFRGLPVPLRYAATGAVALGLLGGSVGLAVGLRTYAPTAWAAVLEAGVPSAVVGALVGLVVGARAVMGRPRSHLLGRGDPQQAEPGDEDLERR